MKSSLSSQEMRLLGPTSALPVRWCRSPAARLHRLRDRPGSFLVAFDAAGQYCGPSVEVLVVGDAEVEVAEQAGGEACAEDAVDPQSGEHCAALE
jgi:hypothetical protein